MIQAAPLTLKRPRPPRALISLVAMIDVLLILLVFFMVTSTYLDLDMIPAVAPEAENAQKAAPQTSASTILIRIGADGVPVIRGQPVEVDDLTVLLKQAVADAPALSVMVLPTGVARMQALVSVMDIATTAGVTNLRVVRLEARP
ncbi:Biopolymer transport protein, ExbD/TolR family [Sulfitobacter noctilucicola]|uniref:Biopolymer transport protein ExbD n=1 Tax=Sulfitobacter noctilucicola TaxID=1342301 RepID=A0A7W6Q5S1_9RHOB|nr:biopolymer transporter ExbD [Sulfitobacter noctilucicola]KIN70006.1 Biopolymer transport protein, ExbD/TolR family [Sulfitobacter noctilucicola]MBB4176018.1 biopolymer transport protein ExbD [Sulfitobacter noctilucicola]